MHGVKNQSLSLETHGLLISLGAFLTHPEKNIHKQIQKSGDNFILSSSIVIKKVYSILFVLEIIYVNDV